MESEYYALALGICEGMWFQRLLNELGITTMKTTRMFYDNQATINIAKNLVHHDKTKHIEIDKHFIFEMVNNRVVQLTHILTRL